MKKMNILIVDDDEDFAESLGEFLEIQGHEIVIAHSGEQAIKEYRANVFDIVFTDIRMPGMNGVEMFLQIKSLNPNAKVVVMTGFSESQLIDTAKQKGAAGILHKPFDMNIVKSLMVKAAADGIILIADDDDDFVTAMQELLQNEGYSVKVAQDGQQAVDHIMKEHIDLLLLDLKMPRRTGAEVCKLLQEQQKLPTTIILTAYADEQSKQIAELQSMSVDTCLRKPVPPETLLQNIQLAMGQENGG